MSKLRIGVLIGGKSIEREVSFNSGRTVCDHLDTNRYEAIPIFQTEEGKLYVLPWHFLHRGKIADFLHRLATQAQEITWDYLKAHIDFMYIATHGRYAEDGTLQGFLELLGIPYLGSKLYASAACMDKIITKQILAAHNIAVPRGIIVHPEELSRSDKIIERLNAQNIHFPCIVKPHREGSSLGVSVVRTPDELGSALTKACFVYQRAAQPALIEEKIEGMEFTCIILTDYKTGKRFALPPTEVVPEKESYFFDYTQKYMPGRAHKFTPPRCTKDTIAAIENTCIKAMDALDMSNLTRTDGFVRTDGTVVIVDPNTLSGMAPNSFIFREAAEIGMNHAALINHLIETELYTYGIAH